VSHPSIKKGEFLSYARLGEVAYIDQCFDEAMGLIKENPGKFLRLTLARIYQFWFSDLAAKNEWTGNLEVSFSVSRLKKLCFLLPLPFMAAGLFLGLKRKIEVSSIIAFLILIPMVYYITHVTQRYRYPEIFASYGFYFFDSAVMDLRLKKLNETR